MVRVSPDLIHREIKKKPWLIAGYRALEKDEGVQAELRMANVMAVHRLRYNDHGVTHSKITAGSALEMLRLLLKNGYEPSVVKDGTGNQEDAFLVVLFGAYLHDVGNAIHRELHHVHGCVISAPILDRILPGLYHGQDPSKVIRMKEEILHTIFSHDEDVPSLTIEAGLVGVADGTDMAEGRARIPYKKGKLDIHSLSALSISSVEIVEGARERPIRILVNMDNPAGVFQIERVLQRKIATSGIQDMVEVVALRDGEEIKIR